MSNFESNAQEVIERLLSAYGVTTQRALAEALNVPSNNVSAWSQRNSVPGSAIIRCVLDTGVDLNWLVKGEFANANISRAKELPSGEELLKEVTSNGGKAVLRRIMNAYGFTLQKQLCEFLGISAGTVSTWIRRNYFPGDVVVTCALETGVDLQWLATGKVNILERNNNPNSDFKIPHKNLSAGNLENLGLWSMDFSFVPNAISEPMLITSKMSSWLIDVSIREISNGKWLLGIDNKYDVYEVTLLPGKKVSINGKDASFTCSANEVEVIGKVALSMNYDF